MLRYKLFGSRLLTTELLTTTLLGLSLIGPAGAQDSSRKDAGAEEVGSLGNGTPQKDLQNLLPLLLTSQDRKQFAAGLEASIRRGDLGAAEASLNAAIEVGTLAIVLSDHLKDPGLLRTLQDLGLQTASSLPAPTKTSAASEAPGTCEVSAAVAGANLAELQQALEQEQAYSAMVSQTLTALMQEHNAVTAQLEADSTSQDVKSTGMQQALQQEQERGETLRQELQRLQEEYQTLQAAKEQAPPVADVSAWETRLQQERERGDHAARQLASALAELGKVQTLKDEIIASATARTSELERALARVQVRGDALTRELADASNELRALKEPRQSGPAPVMFRLAATGAEPPLALPQQESAPAPVAEAKPLPPESKPATPEATSALPGKDPPAVVVASLPEAIQPLPLAVTGVLQPKSEPAGTAEGPKAEDRLVSRADELFHKGDVSGARLLLEHALASGNARAAFLLAETFDPNVLSKLGALGIRGDAAKAREFYARARALGMVQAGERMEALR
jgi:predicted  nucleic acid-binding Zn-ribbon protein